MEEELLFRQYLQEGIDQLQQMLDSEKETCSYLVEHQYLEAVGDLFKLLSCKYHDIQNYDTTE